MGDPMDIAACMQAFMRQAPEQMAACTAALAAAGHGFTAEDRAAIAASAAAHPDPPPSDPAEIQAAAERAMAAEYPKGGFEPDDPRIAPIEGVTFPMYALGSAAIGWDTGPEIAAVAARALGLTPEQWASASAKWNERVAADIVLGAFYGQLFGAASAVVKAA
jgi:hypothetical protein